MHTFGRVIKVYLVLNRDDDTCHMISHNCIMMSNHKSQITNYLDFMARKPNVKNTVAFAHLDASRVSTFPCSSVSNPCRRC